MDRKEFLKKSGLLCFSCLGAAAFLQSCQTAYYIPNTSTGNKITVKKLDFSDHEFVLVKTKEFAEPLYLLKTSENKYSAVLMKCTHKGCELNPAGNHLVCPCHGSEFTNTGNLVEGPAERDLQKFTVTSDDENIYIGL